MVDRFVKDLDDAFSRNPYYLPLSKIKTPEDLRRELLKGVDESRKMSEAQKKHAKEMIESKLLWLEYWRRGKYMLPARAYNVFIKDLTGSEKYVKERAGRIRSAASKGVLRDIIESMLLPVKDRADFVSRLASKYNLSSYTVDKYISALSKAGWIAKTPEGWIVTAKGLRRWDEVMP